MRPSSCQKLFLVVFGLHAYFLKNSDTKIFLLPDFVGNCPRKQAAELFDYPDQLFHESNATQCAIGTSAPPGYFEFAGAHTTTHIF